MAREATITQKQVSAAADTIKAGGGKPTSRAVREALGTGSMATVCKFLEQWRSEQVRQSQVTDDIDPSVARALNSHINAKIQESISESTARLADMQIELATVILENEHQSNAISDLTVEAAYYKEESAKLAGEIKQLSAYLSRIEAEIEKVRAELDVERKSAAKAREEAAELRGHITALKENK